MARVIIMVLMFVMCMCDAIEQSAWYGMALMSFDSLLHRMRVLVDPDGHKMSFCTWYHVWTIKVACRELYVMCRSVHQYVRRFHAPQLATVILWIRACAVVREMKFPCALLHGHYLRLQLECSYRILNRLQYAREISRYG